MSGERVYGVTMCHMALVGMALVLIVTAYFPFALEPAAHCI